jgi:dihydrolipoamide dehydrogenase
MAKDLEVGVPDIGDFMEVDVIEVLVKPGDTIQPEDSLITLESDKATMEVPSPSGGVVKDVRVKVGDKVSQGTPILVLETEVAAAPAAESKRSADAQSTAPAGRSQSAAPKASQSAPSKKPVATAAGSEVHAEVVVLGAGPAGYTAAFRAADLGKQVMLIERHPTLGGVCLNVGCIPSKALLHVAEVLEQAAAMKSWGVEFSAPAIDRDKLRAWKNNVVGRLTSGLDGLARRRQVKVIQGVGEFVSPHQMAVETDEGAVVVSFDHAIIAAGSRAIKLPGFPDGDPRLLDSTAALELPTTEGELLVIGGGVIGLEMATVYHALGVKVTVVELSSSLMPGVDADLVRPLQKRIQAQYQNIYLSTRVASVEPTPEGLVAHFQGEKAPESHRFDYILVAVGRRPNADRIGLEAAGVQVDQAGFIAVDRQQRTNVPHIFAVGDIVGHPLLAHKGSHQGRVAAEVIAGLNRAFDARAIPAVAYTDPEVAWAGITETQAKQENVKYGKGVFPWAASGRSLALGRDEGMTKILFDQETHRVIGVGIVGSHAGDLISEVTLALEMGAEAEDIASTIHPHPTLSETIAMAAESFEGTITDLYAPKR